MCELKTVGILNIICGSINFYILSKLNYLLLFVLSVGDSCTFDNYTHWATRDFFNNGQNNMPFQHSDQLVFLYNILTNRYISIRNILNWNMYPVILMKLHACLLGQKGLLTSLFLHKAFTE